MMEEAYPQGRRQPSFAFACSDYFKRHCCPAEFNSLAMPRSKLLFVDVDGVLNTEDIYWERRTAAERSNLPRHTQMVGLTVDQWRMPCPEQLERLNALLEQSGALAVMTSTWRTLYSLEDMNRLFSEFGLRHPFHAYTPYLPELGRGLEIKQIINACTNLECFVILDDLIDDMPPFLPHVLQIDSRRGLTEEDVSVALTLFAKERPRLVARI